METDPTNILESSETDLQINEDQFWTEKRLKILELIIDKKTDEEIIEEIKIPKAELAKTKLHPYFQVKLELRIRAERIFFEQKRLSILNELLDKLQKDVIDQMKDIDPANKLKALQVLLKEEKAISALKLKATKKIKDKDGREESVNLEESFGVPQL